jgi:uncharacterized repeat protein (TIGR03803 family)
LVTAAPATAQVVNILHNFAGGSNDGQAPGSGLTLSASTLFGVSPAGGSNGAQLGVVFRMNINGTGFGLIHSFGGGLTDGDTPLGTLAISGTTLIGMTVGGGSAANAGTVFRVATDGTGFGVLHSFMGGTADGYDPLGSPVVSGSAVYGMTSQGGTANLGVVYRMNLDGNGFQVIHSFTGGASDGQLPSYSAPVVSGSTIYGMTIGGGTAGQGVVFKMNTDGSGFSYCIPSRSEPATATVPRAA